MLELRPYQREAVDATLAHFRRTSSSACLVLPTGAGKSVVIAELCRLAKGKVLVLAHVKELCQQNYDKCRQLGMEASLYSAGLKQKDTSARAVFASIQSAARNAADFHEAFSLVIVDECHRLGEERSEVGAPASQYHSFLEGLTQRHSRIRLLGLTATPYRLGMGWIYQRHCRGIVRSTERRPFLDCIYELSLRQLVHEGYLTSPTLIDAPVAQYDFSALASTGGQLESEAVNQLLVRYPRVTRAVVEQIEELAQRRQGVMIFASTVQHAQEIAGYLPEGSCALILGSTTSEERDAAIEAFKDKKLKFLVNVSVLTTGFDAPHVDLIAILRPTESVSLYQQMVGRGLRLAPGKADCLIVDYAGNNWDIYSAEIGEKRPSPDSVHVEVECPKCGHTNLFWGQVDGDGEVVDHYGRRCRAERQEASEGVKQCDYRFRFKECGRCGAENDIAARQCGSCLSVLVDPDEQLKAALKLRDARVLRVAGMVWRADGDRLEVTYHDEDGTELRERFDLGHAGQRAVFNRQFGRRCAGRASPFVTAQDAAEHAARVRPPDFVVARKHRRYWRVQQRVFDYVGRYRKAGELR